MFFVLLTGAGDGCDYTIGCNKNFKRLEAETLDDAGAETGRLCDEYGDCVELATILVVTEVHDFDTATHRAAKAAKSARETNKQKRLAAYEKLREEFGDGPTRPA